VFFQKFMPNTTQPSPICPSCTVSSVCLSVPKAFICLDPFWFPLSAPSASCGGSLRDDCSFLSS
jgi:hypothetical protein